MFSIVFLIILAALAICFISLWILNPAPLTILLPGTNAITMNLPELLLAAFLAGMLFMALWMLVREGRRAVRFWKETKHLKKAKESDDLYHRGVEHFLKGNYARAFGLFTQSLEKNPSNLKAFIRMSEVHMARGEYADAIKVLNRGRQFDMENLEILFKIARNSESMGDLAAAEEVTRKILSLDAENKEALRSLRDILGKRKKWEEAYRIQSTLTKLSKGTPEYGANRKIKGRAKYGYAMALKEKGFLDKAVRKLRDVLKLDKDFVPAFISMGDIYCEQGAAAKARETWEDAYRATGHAAFLLRIEEMYLKKEEPETVVNFYKALVEERPQDFTARLLFGKLCLRLEMVEEAQDQLSFIEAHAQALPFLHHLQGELHMRRKRFAEAAEEFRKAADIGRVLVIPFVCGSCGEEFARYSAQCPSCQAWNTLVIKTQEDPLASSLSPRAAREKAVH